MLRHKSFDEVNLLKQFLASTGPSDVYYSAAYYESPTADMDKKGWKGADLIFDIDADHITSPCNKTHDNWACSNCGLNDKGPSPKQCPQCGKAKFDTKTWICEKCLESAKAETIKLADLLLEDFGFADDDMKVYFSGHRGYHVHIESKDIHLLDSMARKEVIDYIIGLGFNAEFHKLIDKERLILGSNSMGWKRRIVNGISNLLEKATPKEIEDIGISRKSAEHLKENRKMLISDLKDKGRVHVKGVGPKGWQSIIQLIVDRQSAKVDTVVTTDIHRLIRMAGSLHGKTGFLKIEVPLTNLTKFDPLNEAIAFKDGQIDVDVAETPEFRIGNITYGPFEKHLRAELPTAAAILLLCKGAAQVVD